MKLQLFGKKFVGENVTVYEGDNKVDRLEFVLDAAEASRLNAAFCNGRLLMQFSDGTAKAYELTRDSDNGVVTFSVSVGSEMTGVVGMGRMQLELTFPLNGAVFHSEPRSFTVLPVLQVTD